LFTLNFHASASFFHASANQWQNKEAYAEYLLSAVYHTVKRTRLFPSFFNSGLAGYSAKYKKLKSMLMK
jgi:hypothetical protein